MNNGGIRKVLSAGPIRKQDVFEVLPFRNILVSFELTGKQVRDIVLRTIKERAGFQMSGVDCEWKRGDEGRIEVVKLLVRGKPVDDQATYKGAVEVTDFASVDNLTVEDFLKWKSQRVAGIDASLSTLSNEPAATCTAASLA